MLVLHSHFIWSIHLTMIGSGSILEALRYQIPLIVVPNTGLLDNHQEELAVAMERNNYLVRGDVKYVDLLYQRYFVLINLQESCARNQEIRRVPTQDVAIPTYDEWEAS